jgi:hypothetical protein
MSWAGNARIIFDSPTDIGKQPGNLEDAQHQHLATAQNELNRIAAITTHTLRFYRQQSAPVLDSYSLRMVIQHVGLDPAYRVAVYGAFEKPRHADFDTSYLSLDPLQEAKVPLCSPERSC